MASEKAFWLGRRRAACGRVFSRHRGAADSWGAGAGVLAGTKLDPRRHGLPRASTAASWPGGAQARRVRLSPFTAREPREGGSVGPGAPAGRAPLDRVRAADPGVS